ncbi:MAG: hypothetical protein Q8N08_09315 [Methanobacteriaceae archaeon]|nr:hypothetical protein [Methanobacteriaceae archaeon]
MVSIRIAGTNANEIGKNFEKAITDFLKEKRYQIDKEDPRRSDSGYEVDFNGKIEGTPVTVECKAQERNINVPLISSFFGKYCLKKLEKKDNSYIKADSIAFLP